MLGTIQLCANKAMNVSSKYLKSRHCDQKIINT